jgi:hypothetical protein
MRKTSRQQSAGVLALVGVCALQLAVAPSFVLAQAPVTQPPPVTPPPTAAPATPVPPPSTQPIPPPPSTTAAPPAVEPTAPPPVYPGAEAAPGAEPGVPAAAEPAAPPAYVEPMTPPPEAPAPQIEAAPTIDEQLVTEPKSKVPSYVLWAVGGASLITGAVLGVTALSAKSDFDDNPSYDSADKVEGRAIAADVAFGLSAVALLTGTIWYFLPDTQTRPATARLQVTPMLGRTNGGALTVKF